MVCFEQIITIGQIMTNHDSLLRWLVGSSESRVLLEDANQPIGTFQEATCTSSVESDCELAVREEWFVLLEKAY